jgi:hypothetical protein
MFVFGSFVSACASAVSLEGETDMAGVDEGFWAGLDKQVAGAVVRGEVVLRGTEKLTRPSVLPAPALVRDTPEPKPVQMPVAAPEWSGVLDIINGARVHAEAQREQLAEQAEAFERAIQEMREDAEAVRQQVRVLEAQHQEGKAELERQVRESRAQAEERMRDIQAKADAQIALARSATQNAEDRAARAEGWLKCIAEASKTLVPSLEATSIRRAA